MVFFAQKGYTGTSLADIAGEIGIKKPSIYAHYPSKMDLFLAVVDVAMVDYQQCWREALSSSKGLPALERLQSLYETVFNHYIDDPVKMALWVRMGIFPPTDSPIDLLTTLKSVNSEFTAAIADIFRSGIAGGDLRDGSPDELAHAFFSLLIGCLIRAVCYRETDFRASSRCAWDCFAAGIKKPENNPR